MVYGELGQYPLFVNSTLKVLKVLVVCFKDAWHQQAYKIMILMDESEKKCWVTEVKHVLNRNGFYCVWLQGVGDKKIF